MADDALKDSELARFARNLENFAKLHPEEQLYHRFQGILEGQIVTLQACGVITSSCTSRWARSSARKGPKRSSDCRSPELGWRCAQSVCWVLAYEIHAFFHRRVKPVIDGSVGKHHQHPLLIVWPVVIPHQLVVSGTHS